MYEYHYWGFDTLDGMDNLALEELFLHKAAQEKRANIRFYDFAKDTVVLGYNQALDALKSWDSSFTVARRGSGGSHVHVGKNILAYSFTVPRDSNFSNHPDFRKYYAEHVAQALENVGLESITTDHDASTIMQSGKVIASHAVVWGVNSALLHGIIMIEPFTMEKVLERVYLGVRKIGNQYYSEASALSQIPTVINLLQAKPYATQEQKSQYVKRVLCESILKEVAGKHYSKFEITPYMLARARKMQEGKYYKESWIKQRDPTFSPEIIEELPGETLTGKLKRGWGYCLYIQVPDKDFKKMSEPQDRLTPEEER